MQDMAELLLRFASSYEKKYPAHEPFVFHVRLREDGTLFAIDLRQPGSPSVSEGENPKAYYTWVTDRETLEKMYEGDLGPGAAAAMEHITDDAPLKAQLPDGESWTMEHYHKVVEFETAFFNPFHPEKVKFGEDFSRPVHGAHAVPLFTARGMRCAWYSIHKGERINGDGHSNPFPSGIIVLSGKMRGRIGSVEGELVAGEAYFIPAGTTHTGWNDADEPCHTIWIAWGIGA